VVEIRWSDLADENLQDIHDFIAKDSIRYADKEITKIFKRVEVLRTYPESGKIVLEFNKETVRELVEGNYRIVYKIFSEQSITILSVHHHSRLLK
jgi:toxin ParE1/3/4